MTDISDADVAYVCGWLRAYIGTASDLSIEYIEGLNVDDVNDMVFRKLQRDVERRTRPAPPPAVLVRGRWRSVPVPSPLQLADVANWPLVEPLKRVIGSLSRRNGNQPDTRVRGLMIAEIQRTLRRTGPPGPKDFEVEDSPPGASGELERQLQRMSECLRRG